MAEEAAANRASAEQMLASVADREKQLQRDQADLQEARERLQKEHAALVQVIARLATGALGMHGSGYRLG